MGLRRRTFLGWLAGLAAAVVSIPRVFGRSLWWRKSIGDEGAESVVPARATLAEDSPGIKVTTIRRTTLRGSAQDFDRDPDVFYIQGEWRRSERPRSWSGRANADGSMQRIYGPRTVTIVRPDLAKMFELNLDALEYVARPYPPEKPRPYTKEQMEALGIKMPSPAEAAKPTFRIETVTKDTGERKDLFGYVARHVITTRREIPLDGSRREAQETTTDAWYIDLEPQLRPGIYPLNWPNGKPRAGRDHSYASVRTPGRENPPEIPEFVDIGEEETGFAVEEIRTSRSSSTLPDGTKSQTEGKDETVVRLEKGPFDPALFEVPSGFRRVSQINPNPT
jgi:hypothetical protein